MFTDICYIIYGAIKARIEYNKIFKMNEAELNNFIKI